LKVIVFTAFADTAAYLYRQLSGWAEKEYGIHSGLVVGTGANQTTLRGIRTDIHSILTNFSPRSKECPRGAEAGEIDLLFATDCVSEGQNLQDCDCLVNYDIHWNPVRIIQRFGRIDRIGSKNSAIQLVNFWPNMELDEYINLESRVSGRMVLLDISATGEENIIEYNKQMNDLEYRRRQLQQLKDAVLDLEDISGGISITDLTLNDFRMDLTEYMKTHLPLLECTPFGARTVAALELTFLTQEFKPGAIFCLKDMSGKAPVESGYPLAPYYLVFVDDDGNIQLNYNQPKRILDVLKKECIGFTSPQNETVVRFNRKTQNGKNMQHYQNLLERAVVAIVGEQQEQGVKSLFQRGGIRLTGESDRSVNDFEVVAFIALLENHERHENGNHL
ncbi:MAG: SWF/SNF helicase family protein, partial [Lentisphaeria bacterium]|nr:SWF/SNF helicase family protein [Lentisphaeria bacterium]